MDREGRIIVCEGAANKISIFLGSFTLQIIIRIMIISFFSSSFFFGFIISLARKKKEKKTRRL